MTKCWMCSSLGEVEVDCLLLCRECAYSVSPARERERRTAEDTARYRAQDERARMRAVPQEARTHRRRGA